MFVDRGSGPNKAVEWHPGDVTGVLPYSRLVTPPGNVIALEPTELLAIPRGRLRAMTRECCEVTSTLVHVMLDRARLFTSSDLQNEKMISLGKLSAGLAHELNNPVSAIERGVGMLEDRLEDTEQATRCLALAALSDDQIAAVDAFHRSCIAQHNRQARSSLEQCDREEEMEAWLASHGLETANAHMLADTDVTLAALDRLAAAMEGPALNTVVRWAAAACAMRRLISMIQGSAMRISSLVCAVKGFTHMDQANAAEPVDLGPSLANTVTVLNSKAREKSVTVTLKLEPEAAKGARLCRRIEPGMGKPDRQCPGRRGAWGPCRRAGESAKTELWWCESVMTGRASRRRFATASSILFSPPSPWDTEPASGLTSPGAWRCHNDGAIELRVAPRPH